MNLYKYRSYYSNFWTKTTDEYGFNFILLTLVLLSPLFKFLPRKYHLLIPLSAILFYITFKYRNNRIMMLIDDTLVIKDLDPTSTGRRKAPKTLFMDMAGGAIPRLLRLHTDQYYHDIRRLACHLLNMNSREVHIRTLAEYPRRQILLNNHTDSPYLDSMAFFPHIPPNSKLIVLQHNFNGLVTAISKILWGAWTIDKDDKTREGKGNMIKELQKLLEVMKTESDLTVVIYPQGRVPKTCQDCRNVGKFYPGAFYLALMSGYQVTPLVNDYSEDGVFRTFAKPSVDVQREYGERIRMYEDIEVFRTDDGNKLVIDELCNRFKKIYNDEYNYITKIEKVYPWTNRLSNELSES